MALKLVGTSQNSTSHELDPSTSPWVTWSLPAVPWIEKGKGIGIILSSGKYRVEPLGGIVRYWSADGSTSTDITGPAVIGEGTLRAYSNRNPATHVVITRLASTPVAGRPVLFTSTEGSKWGFVGDTPQGWSYWGLGRVYPTPGTYRVQGSDGLTFEHRPAQTGTPMSGGQVITFNEGDYILAFGGVGTLTFTRLA
ncbi:hypothetical protein [Corynebacterium aurimucosum]